MKTSRIVSSCGQDIRAGQSVSWLWSLTVEFRVDCRVVGQVNGQSVFFAGKCR